MSARTGEAHAGRRADLLGSAGRFSPLGPRGIRLSLRCDDKVGAGYIITMWKPCAMNHLVHPEVKVTVQIGKSNEVSDARLELKCQISNLWVPMDNHSIRFTHHGS
jgi:hypothetical protein